ncbi:hypothetical protein EJ05DRAFT_502887 [Pseudovirgaria hyperparasitica]|uniref:Uncharacterized protein n=1 Tax=Pseudovirgaria hyperparasitica TaxID=470096 RepID=A0A6A6VYW8_9PEZI|nr:uncharacterized protein EJ05DRAFT_502887 [Pseudovirgaria hyperparasitica]KAF2755425.1 hypothetical protein EJ05DRAFT_502887 [Pseudovirgaria hyperparasitica]
MTPLPAVNKCPPVVTRELRCTRRRVTFSEPEETVTKDLEGKQHWQSLDELDAIHITRLIRENAAAERKIHVLESKIGHIQRKHKRLLKKLAYCDNGYAAPEPDSTGSALQERIMKGWACELFDMECRQLECRQLECRRDSLAAAIQRGIEQSEKELRLGFMKASVAVFAYEAQRTKDIRIQLANEGLPVPKVSDRLNFTKGLVRFFSEDEMATINEMVAKQE